MATFKNDAKSDELVLSTVLSCPPFAVKMAEGDPLCARTAENATVPAALMEGAPKPSLISPLAIESAIRVRDAPSPLKIASEFAVVVAANATTPAELIATLSAKKV